MSEPFVDDKRVAFSLVSGWLDGHGTRARLKQYSNGETIYEPGMSEFVGYVVSGTAKLVTLLPDGRSNLIGLIEAPSVFGRFFGVSTEFTIEAASEVVLACFDRSSFEAQLPANPALEHFIHMQNLRRLDEAHERILVLACQSVIERLATFMVLRLVADQARDQRPVVHVPINRRDFAAYLGTTVETVSRSVQALVRRGTIAVVDSANFKVLRRQDLFDISGQDEDSLLEMVQSRGSMTQFVRPAPPRDRDTTEVSAIEARALRVAAE